MKKIKKWLIPAAISGSGILIFVIAYGMQWRLDMLELAEAQARGGGDQFTGTGRVILFGLFSYLLILNFCVGLAAFGIAALIKRSCLAFTRTSYATLCYRCWFMPVVVCLLIVPICLLALMVSFG